MDLGDPDPHATQDKFRQRRPDRWNGFMTTSQLTGANEISRSRRLDHRAAMHRTFLLLRI